MVKDHPHHHYLNASKRRMFFICALASGLGILTALIAKGLLATISLATNLFYFQRISLQSALPSQNQLGYFAILVPVIGGLIIGWMARWGSPAIRGHGIPEAMENILLRESRIPKRISFLKPLSAAISIGSGGPFGAEGPIIATGGAVGSWLGQIVFVTAYERKILLASGAAAGMTAVFGTPFSAVLLAIELLLFEFRQKSFVPVALAAAVAATMKYIFEGTSPFAVMVEMQPPQLRSHFYYLLIGLFMGVASVYVTKSVYWIEDQFEKLPIHWMWWPPIGGLAVGVIGMISPETLGVGYSNITHALNGDWAASLIASVIFFKFISWSIALGSGTSGGTLAPLLTFGSGMGFLLGKMTNDAFPSLGIDVHVAALVGMAALFAGCSRALLASVVFAFEMTKQPMGIVPLLGSCSVAYLVSSMLMENSIMTEKISRRGVKVPHEYFPPPHLLSENELKASSTSARH